MHALPALARSRAAFAQMNRNNSNSTTADLSRAASDWLVRRDAGFNADEQAEFDEWLRANPNHASAMGEVEAAWSLMEQPRHTGEVEFALRELESRRQRRLRSKLMTAGLGLAAAAAITMMFQPVRHQSALAHMESLAATTVALPERQTLTDGSVIELNAGAEIAVDFSASFRRVRLVRGDAHFTVAKDASRPFLVGAGTVQVRAVGTEFAVQLGNGAVEVLVTEGAVQVNKVSEPVSGVVRPEIADSPANGRASLVTAGHRTVVSLASDAAMPAPPLVVPVSVAEIENALAWRTKRIEFSGTPLAEAVALFNRENRIQLALGDSALAMRQIGGVFWIDDPEGFARLLETSLGLQVTRDRENRIILHRPTR